MQFDFVKTYNTVSNPAALFGAASFVVVSKRRKRGNEGRERKKERKVRTDFKRSQYLPASKHALYTEEEEGISRRRICYTLC